MTTLQHSTAASAEEAMQGRETHARRPRGPDRDVKAGVWTERMLSALANGVKGGKWFSLMDKVFAPATLALAWTKSPRQQRRSGCGWAKRETVRGEGGYVSAGAFDGVAGGHVPSAGGQAGRDSERRWQDATAGDSDTGFIMHLTQFEFGNDRECERT